MEQNTKAHRQRLRQAYIEFGLDMQPNAFVTLTTNGSTKTKPRPKKPEKGPPKALTWRYQGEPQKSDLSRHLDMAHLIGEFLAMMDRALLGRNWSRLPADERTDGIFIIEHTDTNIHAHGLLRFPEAKTLDLNNLTKGKWDKLTEAGDADYRALYDTQRCIAYCTKEITAFSFNPDQVVLARQFMTE
jgi:hypothetical protein